MSPLPAGSPAEPTTAYPAPWRLDRSLPSPWYRLENRGLEAVDSVTLTLLGSARMIAAIPGRLEPGQGLRFAIRGADPADDSILIVKWRRPCGEVYLWRAAF